MPSDGKPKRKKPRKKSELDSALGQVRDKSVAAAMKEFQALLAQAKGDTTELIRQNAEELERRLVLLKKRKIEKDDFDFFVEKSQTRSQGVYRQPTGAGARTRGEIDATSSRDGCNKGCAAIARNDLVLGRLCRLSKRRGWRRGVWNSARACHCHGF
jgi:hypothetical protein